MQKEITGLLKRYKWEAISLLLHLAALFFASWGLTKMGSEEARVGSIGIALFMLGILVWLIATIASAIAKPFSDAFQPPKSFVWFMAIPIMVLEWGLIFIYDQPEISVAVVIIIGINLCTAGMVWVSLRL